MPIGSILLPAIISAVGGVAGSEISAGGQRSANAQSAASQLQAEGWMEKMSDTSFQRRVADLKAAGLNPALAYQQGGASQPSIGGMTFQNPDAAFGQTGQQLSGAMSSAAQLSQASSQQAQVESNTSLNASNAREADSRAALNDANARLAAANEKYIGGAQTSSTNQAIEESKARQSATIAAEKLTDMQRAEVQARLNAGTPQAAVRQMAAATNQMEADAALTKLKSAFQGMTNTQFEVMAPQLLEAQRLANKSQGFENQLKSLGVPKAEADSDFWRGNPGMSYLNAIGHVVGFK